MKFCLSKPNMYRTIRCKHIDDDVLSTSIGGEIQHVGQRVDVQLPHHRATLRPSKLR